MRSKLCLLAAAAFAAGVFGGTAAADPHPNSCATPEVGTGADHISICTPIGYAEGNSTGQYLIIDGAEGNPDPFDGYIVVTAGGVGCADEGDWNAGDPVACP